MLFNSATFIFFFLPAVALGFYLLGRSSKSSALLWLTLASLLFYAWWRPLNVLLIAPSILVNYLLATWMQRLQEKESRLSDLLLVLGIVFNVLFLGYFKYRNFFYESVNYALGTDIAYAQLILPLGISFITFQKIAFLVDVHGGRVNRFSLREYFLFVLFFPQLIAGPIVHYREIMPQFREASCRFQATDLAAGLTLFIFGLFKKVVLADGISVHVSALFQHVSGGGELSLLAGWMAAIGYTLQLYFDFSGYSDMALGMARMFGVRLPVNFDTPLGATSIIDFWRRWHMTLTRFLTAYIYNPLVLALTRRRAASGKPLAMGARFALGPFAVMVAFPTILVMLVSGVWHGAGTKFAIWGLIHGIYLCVNHAWRGLPFVRKWRSGRRYHSIMGPVGLAMTFASVALAMVFFGAPSTTAAVQVLQGMLGQNGIDLPASLHDVLAPLATILDGVGITSSGWWSGQAFMALLGYIVVLTALAISGPNTLQLLEWDAVGTKSGAPQPGPKFLGILPSLRWQASFVWAGIVAVMAAITVYRLGGPSEFLYWQF